MQLWWQPMRACGQALPAEWLLCSETRAGSAAHRPALAGRVPARLAGPHTLLPFKGLPTERCAPMSLGLSARASL